MSLPGVPVAAVNQPEIASEWRASLQLRVAITALAVLFLALPGVVTIGVSQSGSEVNPVGVAVGALLLAGFVALTVFIFWQQSGVRLILRSDGMEYIGRRNRKRILWSELERYVYVPMQRRAGYYGGGLIGVAIAAAVAAASSHQQLGPAALVLVGRDRTRIRINAHVARFKELIQRLIPIATGALYPAIEQAFDAGQTISFGERLTVNSSDGITWRPALGSPRTLPFSAMARAQLLEGQRFVVRVPGKTFPWLGVAMAQVPNLFALVQLLNHARQPSGAPAVAEGGGRLPGAFAP